MMQAETVRMEETLESFSCSLSELTVNSKPLINILSGVAAENMLIAAAIVKTVNDYLENAPSAVILPILYLIDSIMKNVGGDYINLFSLTLKDRFANIFSKADKTTRHLMCHLRQTWSEILSIQDLGFIDQQVHSVDPHWPNSVVSPENHPLKILVNPNFLHPIENTAVEDDDEEILREQLIQQMKRRKLEKEQGVKDREESCGKGIDAAISSQGKEFSKTQADSTTVEKLANASVKDDHPANQCQNPSTVPSTENSSILTKQANSELLKLLSNLIVKGNKKIQCNKYERQSSYSCRQTRQEPRRERREYRKREKLYKHFSIQSSQHGSKVDDKYHDYSNRKNDRSWRGKKYVKSQSHVLEEKKDCGHQSPLSDRVKASSESPRRCDNLPLVSSDCIASPSINAECIGVHDSEREVFIECYSPPPKKKVLQTMKDSEHQIESPIAKSISAKQETLLLNDPTLVSSTPKIPLLSAPFGEQTASIPVHLCYSPPQRMFDDENGGTSSHSGHLKLNYSAERSCTSKSNVKHLDDHLELKPLEEIDYKHGCGAPERRLCDGFNENNRTVCSPVQPPLNHGVSLRSFDAPVQNNWQAFVPDQNIYRRTRHNPVLPSSNLQDCFSERIAKDSWDSKIMTQDLKVEYNMVNFPSIRNNFESDEIIQGCMNSTNVDTMTAQVRFYSENRQYSRNVTPDRWQKTARTSLSPVFQHTTPFLRKGGKLRHKNGQRMKRQIMRSMLNGQGQLQNLSDPLPFNLHSESSQLNCAGPSSNSIMNGPLSSPTLQSEVSTSESDAFFRPCVNVHALFQSLCEVGLLIHPSSPNIVVEGESIKNKIHPVDFKNIASFRRRQPGIIDDLYYGLQCSSCGERFATEQTTEYREHLDGHFKHNHNIRDSKSSQNRKWYCTKKRWVQSEQCVGGKDKVLNAEPDKEKSSVPSNYFAKGAVCEVCRDRFEEFFYEDQDEWHLKDCLSSESLPYHPSCFKDLKISTAICDSGLDCKDQDTLKQCDSSLNLSRTETCDEAGNGRKVENCDKVQPVVPLNIEDESNKDEGYSCLSPKIKCDAMDQSSSNQMSSVEVQDKVSDACEDGCIANGTSSSLSDVSWDELDVSILKPKLVGRKLTKLPPAVKGSETSNLCCLS